MSAEFQFLAQLSLRVADTAVQMVIANIAEYIGEAVDLSASREAMVRQGR